jgi:phospholipase C
MNRMTRAGRALRVAAAAAALAAFTIVTGPIGPIGPVGPAAAAASTGTGTGNEHAPRTPIKHFVYLMQGDRTFDNYFSTYPGAKGPPRGTCQPLVLLKPKNGCVKPFPLHGRNVPPLAPGNTVLDYQYDRGKLDGFVAAYLRQGRDGTNAMGYYDRRDLPYYWAVADQFVLFDNFFAAARHGIRTNRSFWVSAAPQPGGTESVGAGGYGDQPTIFDRLQQAGVSWKFYVEGYNPKETFRSRSASNPAAQTVRVPLLDYARFVDDPALRSHIVDLREYYQDLADGTLPAVAYVASSGSSERSARSIGAGQELVRRMVTQLMASSAWSSSALMWSYDGSGGWFDHVPPPTADGVPLGLRVPALLVSPYARRGVVEHAQLDPTGALAFVEQNWGVAPLTDRDAKARSIATVLDLRAPPRAPEVILAGAPVQGPKVAVGTAYLGYLSAALLAGVLFVAAAAGPDLVVAVRRRRMASAARDPDGVLAGIVMTGDRAVVPEER